MKKVTRRIQKTGKSSYTVSIPNDWVEKVPYSEDPRVTFHQLGEALVLNRNPSQRREYTVETEEKDLTTILNEITRIYTDGYEKIKIDSSGIPPDQKMEVIRFVRGLKGMEIFENSGEELVAQDILDLSEFPPKEIVKRTLKISESAIDASVEAYLNNKKQPTSVHEMSAETLGLWNLNSRFYSSFIYNPDKVGDVEPTIRDLIRYSSFIYDLHNVTRVATRISEASGQGLPEKATAEVERVKEISKETLSDSILYAIGELEITDLPDERTSLETSIVSQDKIPYSSIEDEKMVEIMMVLFSLSSIHSKSVGIIEAN